MPVYGIDSPYLRCPSRLTTEVGIPGAAKFIAEALLKFQPDGSFALVGFSGGAMLAYEVCRQLSAAGRHVDSLLLIYMRRRQRQGRTRLESLREHSRPEWPLERIKHHPTTPAVCPCLSGRMPPATHDGPGVTWADRHCLGEEGFDLSVLRQYRAYEVAGSPNIPIATFAGFMEDPTWARSLGVCHTIPLQTSGPIDGADILWRGYFYLLMQTILNC